MPQIDIPLKPDIRKLLDMTPCEFVKLPAPAPMKVQLPTGSTIKAFTDISKGIPTDCSMTLNLLALASTVSMLADGTGRRSLTEAGADMPNWSWK